MDSRLTPFNGRVAAEHLHGVVEAEHYSAGTARLVAVPVANLLRSPNGPRDRQLLMGDRVTVYDDVEGYRYIQSAKDGYVGYVSADSLGSVQDLTHWVAVPAGHIYSEPDIKSLELAPLNFGARLAVSQHMPKFYETVDGGFVPKPFLRGLDRQFTDPVTVAQLFFGTPYLWGGNSSAGIDCSGLVQAACLACDIPCPGDSDMQADALGEPIALDAPVQRGDLYFWKGHVAMAVDAVTLIHANAHHMAVAYEPLENAIYRIEAQGDGPVNVRRRLAR